MDSKLTSRSRRSPLAVQSGRSVSLGQTATLKVRVEIARAREQSAGLKEVGRLMRTSRPLRRER